MKTKYFEAKIGKKVNQGHIELTVSVHYFSGGTPKEDDNFIGQPAYIFTTTAHSLRLRQGLPLWDKYYADCKGDISFDTGASACQWIERLRQHLIKLDAHVDHLLAEIDALPN